MEIQAQGLGRTVSRVGDTTPGRGHPGALEYSWKEDGARGIETFKAHLPPCHDGWEGTKRWEESQRNVPWLHLRLKDSPDY